MAVVLMPALFSCSNGKVNDQPISRFEFSYESAHPNAKALMKEEFFWSPIEETGPFGSDDGSDAAHSFLAWRMNHLEETPMSFLKDMIASWNYPYFDYFEMDTVRISTFLRQPKVYSDAELRQQVELLKDAAKNAPATNEKQMTDEEIKNLIRESSKGLNGIFLVSQDNGIIGTGFAQFALEGRIDPDLKTLTAIAIKRQLLPILLNRYDEAIRKQRSEQLTKMLEVINQSGS